jgi:hypothetical protein
VNEGAAAAELAGPELAGPELAGPELAGTELAGTVVTVAVGAGSAAFGPPEQPEIIGIRQTLTRNGNAAVMRCQRLRVGIRSGRRIA